MDPTGFEPTTSCMRSRRSPNWAKGPSTILVYRKSAVVQAFPGESMATGPVVRVPTDLMNTPFKLCLLATNKFIMLHLTAKGFAAQA